MKAESECMFRSATALAESIFPAAGRWPYEKPGSKRKHISTRK